MKGVVKIFIVFVGLIFSRAICADVLSVTNKRSLEAVLDKNELAVVLFYEQDREIRKDKATNDQIEAMEKSFESAARSEKYVRFIRVNLAKDKLDDLRQEYRIGTTPIVMLFRRGLPYEEKGGQEEESTFWGMKRGDVKSPVVLTGFRNRSEIVEFIRDSFNEYIDEIKQQKREEAAERRARSAYYGPYLGVSWGTPYYWYPYGYYGYYGRPGFYWGVGW
ncbi:hypothetical protein JW872_02790 [Candidatus Babeliales bacterium]|nr:hypothetical protein [Candidatus Babeliales bacterium]